MPILEGPGGKPLHNGNYVEMLAKLIVSLPAVAPRTLKGTRYAIEQWGLVPLWGQCYGNWFARLACDPDSYIVVLLKDPPPPESLSCRGSSPLDLHREQTPEPIRVTRRGKIK